jgi:DNA primase
VGIVDEDVVRVREATDIVAVISERIQLRKVGQRWSGLCPFHQENSPSFSVNQQLGVYHCFGCQKSGDAITFVRELEGLDFVGAVERLAAKAGITLRYTDPEQGEGRKKRRRLVEAIEAAVDFYHERLLTSPDAGGARKYLRERGITGDEVRAYRIGWAPDDWDALARGVKVSKEVLATAGLGFVNKRNRMQDTFRARILFPIFDVQGDAVGFGGRKLPDAEGPKYKNSPESPVYAKSRLLYGLNWAKEDVVQHDEVIVCEGYTDVIGFARAGVPRAVATCGTALTEDHIVQLKRFARRLVLAFDADNAGQAAAERVYAWERSHDVDVTVADLPAGVDPAELALADPARLQQAVSNARPFLAFRLDRHFAASDLSTAEGRAKAAERALAMVAEHPNELVRDQYLVLVAERCRLDPASLRAVGPRPVAPRPAASQRPIRRDRETVELQMLRLAVHRPELVAAFVDESLFADDLYREAFATLLSADELHQAVASASEPVAELLQRLAVEDDDVVDDRGAEHLAGRMVDDAVARRVAAIAAEVRRTGDLELGRRSAELQKAQAELRDHGWRIADAERLLSWLVGEAERP